MMIAWTIKIAITTTVMPLIIALASDYSPRADLNFSELVSYDGYTSETHTVSTEDGYILTLFRIPLAHKCEDNPNSVPIFFQHGLYLSGDDCIIPGPGKAHCYIFADECFDIWIANSRGNRYSRKHKTLDPDKDKDFWFYSFHEMGTYDLPANIDYVLKHTKKQQIAYVGHSAAVASLVVLMSKRPEYNNKIKTGFALSATAWLDHSTFPIVYFQGFLAALTLGKETKKELFAHGSVVNGITKLFCGTTDLTYPWCSFVIFATLGYDHFQITKDVMPVILGHSPAGTSLTDFTHWGQIRNHGFREFSYGPVKNMMKYGQVLPPTYELSKVTTKLIFMCSLNDRVGTIKDIAKLQRQLVRSNSKMCIAEDESFGHLDFVYGKSLGTLITSKIIAYLRNGINVC